DILSVCMNIEHSYIGDLELRLIAPNGQSMVLKYQASNMPGGGGGVRYFGHPIDPGGVAEDAAAGPGIGETYCFTPDATVYIINGPTQPAQITPGNSIIPGDYMPSQPFTNLVGAPLNGVWTLEIIDILNLDNGYIFGWDINFDEDLVPDNLSMNTFLVDATWQENEDIVFQNGTDVVVRPTQAGQNCYTVEL